MATPIPLTTDGSGPDGAIPVTIYGDDGGDVSVDWADVTGKPATFPPIIGTTAETAKAGNYVPAWGEITSKPAVIAAGADATAARVAIDAAPTNHTQAATTVTVAASEGIVGDNVQLVLENLAARIEALEP